MVGLRWTGTTEADLGPGRVELSAGVGPAETAVALPPLGRVAARTHRVPISLDATVVAIDVEGVQRALTGADPAAALERSLMDELPGVVRGFVVRLLALSAVLGALAALLLPHRRWWHAVPGAAGAVLGVGLALVAVWVPYDREAFGEPRFEGELARAPAIVSAVERGVGDLDVVRGRVETLAQRLADLYAVSAGALPGGAPGETAILHVSDLHLNPLGAQLVVELAEAFDVDAVLDTGDVTTFGFTVEASFGELLTAVDVPYLLVPGNHDSALNREQLAATEGITLVDGEVVEVAGLRILGIGDPTFTASNELSTESANRRKLALADAVAERVEEAGPDVLAVHDARQASESAGLVPLVVAGHSHQRGWDEVDGTLVLTVGSTGATGLGAFTVEASLAYEAQILRFEGTRLVAVDYLRVEGVGGDFQLERRLVPEPDPTDEEGDDGDGANPSATVDAEAARAARSRPETRRRSRPAA